MTSKKIDSFIIGAQKSGTTTLYHHLSRHPKIEFSAIKELTFFVDDQIYVKGFDYLSKYFPSGCDDKLFLSSYVHMLASEKSAQRLYDYNSKCKIIVILRNPVDRAYSAYLYARQKGWELNESFESAVQSKNSNVNCSYLEDGLYYRHLRNWMKYYDRDQFLILTTAELKDDAQTVFNRISEFLDISSLILDNPEERVNSSAIPRSTMLQWLLYSPKVKNIIKGIIPDQSKLFFRRRVIRILKDLNSKKVKYDGLSPERRSNLMLYFDDDLRKLREEFNVEL